MGDSILEPFAPTFGNRKRRDSHIMEGDYKMSKIFYPDDIPNEPGYYMVRLEYKDLPFDRIQSSLNVLPARLLGLSYAEYLRYCRDVLGAVLIGKNSLYVIAIYDSREKAQKAADLFNEKVTPHLKRWHLKFDKIEKL